MMPPKSVLFQTNPIHERKIFPQAFQPRYACSNGADRRRLSHAPRLASSPWCAVALCCGIQFCMEPCSVHFKYSKRRQPDAVRHLRRRRYGHRDGFLFRQEPSLRSLSAATGCESLVSSGNRTTEPYSVNGMILEQAEERHVLEKVLLASGPMPKEAARTCSINRNDNKYPAAAPTREGKSVIVVDDV